MAAHQGSAEAAAATLDSADHYAADAANETAAAGRRADAAGDA